MASQPLPDIRDSLPTNPGHPGGPTDHSDILEGLLTTHGLHYVGQRRMTLIKSPSLDPCAWGLIDPGFFLVFHRPPSPSRPLPEILEGLPTTPGHSGGHPDHSRTSGRDSRPLPEILEILPFTPGHPRGTPDHFQRS